ncbi:MAG: hypothetical protein AB1458_00895 [Bacteroidota bacterium]
MKKAKLKFNFFSAADKVFSAIAVLFIPALSAPVCSKVPYFPRR